MNNDYTLIGKITNTHGINGAVKVFPYTDYKERFEELKSLYLGDSKMELTIKKVAYYKNLAIIEFEEFNNINQILKYKDHNLYIRNEDRRDLEEDTYFITDLIGCKVFDTKDLLIGEVVDVLTETSNDILVINSGSNEYLVPSVKEFIKKVDIDNKTIVIQPIKGLLE
ncbi:MAG: 16S rRNA processing protein RimM [Tissierellia bacterium]|nr:16S rRNA processing protein RimM [Tissierellia bacterium]